VNRQSPDVIDPVEGASTVFRYNNGNSAAVKSKGKFKVVYFGFGLEAVDADEYSNIGDPSPLRTDLLMNTLNWMNFLELQLLDSTQDVKVPVKIAARLSNLVSNVQSFSLFWRHQGEVKFSRIEMTENEKGIYLVELPVKYGETNIDYYLTFSNSYYDWHSPIDAPESYHSLQTTLTAINGELSKATDFSLEQNYPNPFNPTTTITFYLPKSSMVTLKVYNIMGEEITTLVSETYAAGKHEYKWDATNMPSGLYFYRIKAGSFTDLKKMILMK
jgi:hypothetical protein